MGKRNSNFEHYVIYFDNICPQIVPNAARAKHSYATLWL